MQATKRLTVDQFAAEHNVSASTVYRWLAVHPSPDRKQEFGETTYSEATLLEAKNSYKFKGERNIQNKLDVSIRSLKSAGFVGYGVDDKGNVYNLDTKQKLTSRRSSEGYVKVDLGRYGTKYVHRLVAAAVHGLPFRRTHTVDHINGNKADNRAENLQWVTGRENNRRRDKSRFKNKRQPFKFTSTELAYINTAFARNLGYAGFCKRYPHIEISSSHFYRLRTDFRAQVDQLPSWSRMQPIRRYRIAQLALRTQSFDDIADEFERRRRVFEKHREEGREWTKIFNRPARIEEYIVIWSWLDFYGMEARYLEARADDLKNDPRPKSRAWIPWRFEQELKDSITRTYSVFWGADIWEAPAIWLPRRGSTWQSPIKLWDQLPRAPMGEV